MLASLAQWALEACTPSGRDWLRNALGSIAAPLRPSAWLALYARAGRQLGNAIVSLSQTQRDELARAGGARVWTADELGRAALLVAAARCVEPGDLAALADEVYYKGDNRERQALLRTLGMLPAPERFVALAVEACRSNVRTVFEAIAADNPYPASHFPEESFNQVVLKALFVEMPLARVIDLARRTTPALMLMASDYARERLAAGRTVPSDVRLVTGDVSCG